MISFFISFSLLEETNSEKQDIFLLFFFLNNSKILILEILVKLSHHSHLIFLNKKSLFKSSYSENRIETFVIFLHFNKVEND